MRSVTAMSIVLMTDRPPTISANKAAPVVIAVNRAPPDLKLLTIVLGLVALTPLTWLLMLSDRLSRLTPGLPYTVMPVTSVLVSIRSRMAAGRLSLSNIWASVRLMNAAVSGPVLVLASTPTAV